MVDDKKKPEVKKIQVFFKVYNKTKKLAGITLPLEVRPNEKIRAIKNKIRDKEGVPVDAQWIIFGLDHLEDDKTLADYGVHNGYTLYCTPTTCEVENMVNL